MSTQDIVQTIVNQIKQNVSLKTIDASSVMTYTLCCMELVEKVPNLSGEEKQQTVVNVLKNIVDTSSMNSNDKLSLDLIISTVVPTAINTIVKASNGETVLNLKKMCFCC